METHSPGDLLRRFVLDFLVEEALRHDPTVDGDKRKALGASFSVEPMADLGYARKYRVISPNTPSNIRVYVFMFSREINDKAFRSTEQLYRRSLTVLREQDPGAVRTENDIVIRETLKRHRIWEDIGLIISELSRTDTAVPPVPLDRFSDVPRSLVELGILEIHVKGSAQKPAEKIPEGRMAKLVNQARINPLKQGVSGEISVSDTSTNSNGEITVHDWIKRAYEDTFGEIPIHISTNTNQGPVITLRVMEISEKHETWAVEVTRHLRIREGSLDLTVQLLEVK